MTTLLPTPVVTETALYEGDNGQILCGKHCGTSARYTGRDISGMRIRKVTDQDAVQWYKEVGKPIQCEACILSHPPLLVKYTSRARWSSESSKVRTHVCTVSMQLASMTRSGPTYTMVKVLEESGAPPTNARRPTPLTMAWSALPRLLASGDLTVMQSPEATPPAAAKSATTVREASTQPQPPTTPPTLADCAKEQTAQDAGDIASILRSVLADCRVSAEARGRIGVCIAAAERITRNCRSDKADAG